MKNEIDELLGSVFGKNRTLGPQNLQSKEAPTLVFGNETVKTKTPAKAQSAPTATQAPTAKKSSAQSSFEAINAIEKAVPEMSRVLDARLAQQRKEIEQLNENALADIQRIEREINTPTVKNLATQPQAKTVEPGFAGKGMEDFVDLAAALGETVFGQDAYLAKLAIALKRPYVMQHSGESAKNSFVITGPRCTGKRLSLTLAAKHLKEKGIFGSSEIAWVDLALYPTPAEEKLFLQDIYMAFASDAEMVAFTHYENCHSGLLSVLSNLVKQGRSPLSNRYVLQNGRLIEAGNALVSDAVSALTPRGKYLVFITTQPITKFADSFGAPFISALGDVCETVPLTKEAQTAVSSAELKKLVAKSAAALQMKVHSDDAVHTLAVTDAGKGAQHVLAFWEKAYKALAQYKLENDTQTQIDVQLAVENQALTADFGSGAAPLFAFLPGEYIGALAQIKAQFDEIVGLSTVKEYILSLEDHYKVQMRRKAQGMKTAPVSMHMIFTGNPGTGKTTIARLVSKYLKAIGVLSGGQLVEVTRADLVGKYVGHTAPLTTQVIQSAIGGVLFIDEAYSLYRGKDDVFGLECIDTLVKGMEDNRDNLLVILAGYSREMAEFLSSNSGLKSRFPNIIEFPDYTGEELLAITKLQAQGKGYTIDAACDAVLISYFNARQLAHAKDAGNGRMARNKLEEAMLNQSRRVAHQPQADLSLLLPEDFDVQDIQ